MEIILGVKTKFRNIMSFVMCKNVDLKKISEFTRKHQQLNPFIGRFYDYSLHFQKGHKTSQSIGSVL